MASCVRQSVAAEDDAHLLFENVCLGPAMKRRDAYRIFKGLLPCLSGRVDRPSSLSGSAVADRRGRHREGNAKRFHCRQHPASEFEHVGIYRFVMKAGYDNFRDSPLPRIMTGTQAKGVEAVVFEPSLPGEEVFNSPGMRDLDVFNRSCDLIVANQFSSELRDVSEKVFTRDLFRSD